MPAKKRFFASHAKSSAALVSIIVHVIIIVIAFTFVAVTVITKQEKKFESRTVSRPKMQLKKLQVPVNIKKKRPEPKLRKRIVAKPRMNQSMPDIQLPEISGVKGGIGNSSGSGLGGSSLGFSMPEIEVFGVKGRGKGEKVIIILDAETDMMIDELGGVPAYTIIKEELIRIIGDLPSATLFNILVYAGGGGEMAFPSMVSATDDNVQKLNDWLMPLNASGRGNYGLKSLGDGGTAFKDNIYEGKFADPKQVGGVGDLDLNKWYRSVMVAHKMQADTIFLLTSEWGKQRVPMTDINTDKWYETAAGKKWTAAHQEALKKLEQENKERAAAGRDPKKIEKDPWSLAHEYYPDLERPPQPDWYHYSGKDFAEAFVLVRQKYMPKEAQTKSGLGKSSKSQSRNFSFNVIRFTPQRIVSEWHEKQAMRFDDLTKLCDGEYKKIPGLDALKNLVR